MTHLFGSYRLSLVLRPLELLIYATLAYELISKLALRYLEEFKKASCGLY